ncbi:MAG: glycosyltransferase [Candidatus Omnitrophota bacterium]
MKILFVNHAFPPESFAGSEIYVYNLAKELQRRRCEVGVFYRYSDAKDDEYSLQYSNYDGIPTFKINHTYRYSRTFQDIYLNNAIAAKFGYFLREFQPDVVHFNHLTNLSLSFVKEAKAYGAVRIFTLHDYWLLCQRGQLLKRDLSHCHGPSDEDCRSCLAMPLLRGGAQRLLSRLIEKTKTSSGADVDLRQLKHAKIVTENPAFVGLACFELGDAPGETLLTHPPAEIVYPLNMLRPALLTTAIAMHPNTYSQPGGGVRFEIIRNEEILFSRLLNPKKEVSHQGWHPIAISLAPMNGENDRLILRVEAETGDNQFGTAGWRAPVIHYAETAAGDPLPPRLRQLRELGAQAVSFAAEAAAAFSERAKEGISHRKNWIRRVWDDVDMFISPSRYLRDFFIRYGLPENKTIYSDYGFVFPEAVSRTPREGPMRFGYIGTWIPSKGLDVALKAFRGVDAAKAKLFVYGYFPGYDGYEDYESCLRAFAGPAVEFRGKYAPESVFEILAQLDCLIMPSIWRENSPLTIHEAFLARLPVITADAGGMAELVREGGGLTFRSRDPDSLNAVVQSFIDRPERLDFLRARIPEVKSIAKNADEMLQLYSQLMAQSKQER